MLSQDDREELRDLVDHEAWPALIRYCEAIVKRHESAVLDFDVTRTEHNHLLIAKARLDGARALAFAVKSMKAELKERKKKNVE